MYLNYPSTDGGGEWRVQKVTVPGVSPPIVITGRGCISRLQDIYSWRGFCIPNILRPMTNKTRAHLDNALDIHKLGPQTFRIHLQSNTPLEKVFKRLPGHFAGPFLLMEENARVGSPESLVNGYTYMEGKTRMLQGNILPFPFVFS